MNQIVGINANTPEQAKTLAAKMSTVTKVVNPDDLDRLLSAVQKNPSIVKKALGALTFIK